MGTIVILDDHQQNLTIFSFAINPLGHQVVGIDNPYKIYDEVQRVRPDLIILDLSLPVNTNGIEIGRRIRRDFAPDTPMFAVTASPKFTSEMAMEAGFNEFLMRPVSVKVLRDLIGKWLPS
jgi:CheY-like chemotaxis protein